MTMFFYFFVPFDIGKGHATGRGIPGHNTVHGRPVDFSGFLQLKIIND